MCIKSFLYKHVVIFFFYLARVWSRQGFWGLQFFSFLRRFRGIDKAITMVKMVQCGHDAVVIEDHTANVVRCCCRGWCNLKQYSIVKKFIEHLTYLGFRKIQNRLNQIEIETIWTQTPISFTRKHHSIIFLWETWIERGPHFENKKGSMDFL